MNRRSFMTFAAGACIAGARRRAQDAPAAPPVPLLDAHTHLSSRGLEKFVTPKMGANPFEDPADAAAMIARLDAAGHARALVLSSAYMMATDMWRREEDPATERARVRAENDFVAGEVAKVPDRLVAFGSVNPQRPDALEEIDRCAGELRMTGLKLHMWNSLVDVRDEAHRARVRAVLERAAARGQPVVVHAFVGAVPDYGPPDIDIWVRELVQPLDGLRICFAHLGGPGGFSKRVQAVLDALVKRCGPDSAAADRVFVDLSAVLVGKNPMGLPPTPAADRTRMGELLTAWGLDRVLWGSDNIPDYLGLSSAAWPLAPESWARIAGQTGARFLDA